MSNKNVGWNLASKVMVMAIVISVILLFLAIGALILIHICLVARTFSRLSNGGGGGGGIIERGSNGSTSMSRDDVEKLPCYDYLAKSSKGSSPIECSVCLENFKKGDKCRLLPTCTHSFHAQCVDTWLLKNPNCPICRTPAGSRRFDEDISSRFSDIDVELIRQEEGMPPTESSRELNDIIRINETQLLGHSQNQTNLDVADQFGPNPFPLADSSLENV